MNLRDQITNIALKHYEQIVLDQFPWPTTVNNLVWMAFTQQWEEGVETRAIRKAALLLEKTGLVTKEEPCVE